MLSRLTDDLGETRRSFRMDHLQGVSIGRPLRRPAARRGARGGGGSDHTPAPHRARGQWLIGGVATALVVVLVIVGALVVFTSEAPRWQRNDEGRAAVAASRNLAWAATDLTKLPAARLTGTLAGRAGRSIPVDITVSSEGSGKATLTVGGEQVEAVVLPDVLYVRASEAFWRREGAAADTVADFGQQWVKADPELFGGDLTTILSPGALGRLLSPHEGGRPVAGDVERVNGVEVRPMRVNSLTAYVTTAEPHRIVRLTTDGPATSGTPSPGSPAR